MKTVTIHGSQGEVMAPAGSGGVFIRGKHRKIRIIQVGLNEDVPLVVREALVGLEIPVIFDDQQLALPKGAMAAYAPDVRKALLDANKGYAEQVLGTIAGEELDMYAFEPGTYEVVE